MACSSGRLFHAGFLPALALLPLLGSSLVGCAGGNASTAAGALEEQDQGDGFDAARAWADLEAQVAFGARPSGSAALDRTREWIEKRLREAGLEPVREAFETGTPVGPIAMANVYADLVGTAPGGGEPPMVILVSHFDTKRMDTHVDRSLRDGIFLGANDGASSTAVLIELARVLTAGPARPVSYRFLFVDGEESMRWDWDDPDNRYGSRHHAGQLVSSGAIKDVKACVGIDLVGDADLQLTYDTHTQIDKELFGIFLLAAKNNGLEEYVFGKRQTVLDDHLSFVEVGIPSCDLIDLDFTGPDEQGVRRNWWHTTEDTIARCSQESLDAVGRIVLLGLPGVEEFALRGR